MKVIESPIRHENYSYILRLPPRGWYNQWRMHKVTGWQCKAPGAHSRKSEHFRRNLSAAACMDYTSPPMGQLFEARRAEFWTIGEISECNSYMSQRLDFLRRSNFMYKAPRAAVQCLPTANPIQPIPYSQPFTIKAAAQVPLTSTQRLQTG